MHYVTEQEVRICITLVHGTWPRGVLPTPSRLWGGGRCWFESGSRFWKELLEGLRAKNLLPTSKIDAFLWSGANSIIERDRVARALAQVLVRARSS